MSADNGEPGRGLVTVDPHPAINRQDLQEIDPAALLELLARPLEYSRGRI